MKKLSLLILSFFMLFVFSFKIIHVQAQTNDADKLAQVKEIRKSIKNHLKANEKLEISIEKKSKQIEKILVKLPQSSLVSQEVIDTQVTPKLEVIMSQLMQVGEYETASWKHLNIGNKQIKNKKYNAGIKHLKEADLALKEKHESMIRFEEDLDAFLIFISSLQHK